ncbi:MAG: helix-turn-helix domain-containing protein [Sulfuritalea sp.]|nr:helix-turn-helix domain-containing protein [Sulfuritalea sp.]
MTTAEIAATQAHRRDRELLDSQDHAGELAGWEQNYDQISRGAFHSRLVEIEFDNIHIFQEELSQAVFQTGQCKKDTVALGVFSAMSGEARWHGGAVGMDDVLFLEGQGELVLTTPKTSCIMGIGFPTQLLEAWCADTAGCARERIRRFSATPLHDRLAAEKLRISLTGLIIELLNRPDDKLPVAVARQLQDDLAGLMVSLLCGEPCREERRATGKAKKVVQRARAFALDRRDEPPTMIDVCNHTYVSLRTLQNCFQAVLGESPATYLKMLRLNGARRDLMKRGDNARVSDIAAEWGFWHLSQFSSDYRRMFGELPSVTRTGGAGYLL